MSFEEAVGRDKVHLSLFFLVPLILVLFAVGPLWIAITILSKSLSSTWNAGLPISPDQVESVVRLIAIDFGISGLTALVAGVLIAYAITRPIARFRHAFQDITSGRSPERLRVETSGEFVHLNEEFNRMVSSLQVQEKLRQTERLVALGALAAGVAHEIRNPLGSIRGLAQMLKEDTAETERKRYADAIVTQADRLNRALETLLHLARPSSPSVKRENLNILLHRAVELVDFERSQKGITLSEQYEENLPEIELDSEAMLQAFFNVLLNAVQAIPEAGEITIRTSQTPAGPVWIEMRNSRSTIPARDLKRIFDPFFTTKEDGTGLGLAITHQVVTAHGGTIEVKSGNDETTFTIELPVK